MNLANTRPQETESMKAHYRGVRALSEQLCEPLATEDYQLQSITETSPPKWHLAHVTWFFEAFVLSHFQSHYRPFHPQFHYLFNSYYETVGDRHPRPKRGLLSRPTVEEVYRYRAYVDERMLALLDALGEQTRAQLELRTTLGLHHEQQHQELLLMDTKHNLAVNPLKPAYREDLAQAASRQSAPLTWRERPGGIREIGHADGGFAYDNESPRHRVLLRDHRLAERLVTNAEYLAFMADGGYERCELWLADGWYHIQRTGWRHPLYWQQIDGDWWEFTLGGLGRLDLNQPVAHVSFYEAEAYARWAGKRLSTEAELETLLAELPLRGNFLDADHLHPVAGQGQWYGDLWEWTASPYGPYPGFRPLEGSLGEYNGKFMCNQMALRGGCCITPRDHLRASYRNFFYPHERWPYTGIRLAEDAG